jgi:soluble lytic murein transglycosylase-like protein
MLRRITFKYFGLTSFWSLSLMIGFVLGSVFLMDLDPSDDFSFSFETSAQANVDLLLPQQKMTQLLTNRLSLFPVSLTPRLAQHLTSLCKKYRFDPAFVLSVIQVESEFRIHAVSHAGAIGLMQVKPTTAQYVVEKIGIEITGFEGFNLEDVVENQITERMLEDPFLNMTIGIAYLDWLRNHLNATSYELVAAYNIGPTRMRKLRARKHFEPVETKKYFHAVRRWISGFRSDLSK